MTNNDKPQTHLCAIVAVADDWAIGREGQLLCHLPADMRHFKEMTMGGAVLMGRRTFDSLPKGALPGRTNIVLTSDREWQREGVLVAHSLDEALALAQASGRERTFVMGGAQVYREALPLVETIYLTHIHGHWPDADVWFPTLDATHWRVADIERHTADDAMRGTMTSSR